MGRKVSEFQILPPSKGLVTVSGFESQPHDTSPDLLNVRLFDPHTGKRRLSKRCGLTKYVSDQVAAYPIQDLIQYITTADTDGDGEQDRRAVINLVTCNGVVQKFTSSAVSAITGTAGLSTSKHQIFSARLFGNVFWVDGNVERFYTPGTDTIAAWTATTDGTVPADARLIEMWRGRIVLSGIAADPHNWYMSRLGDAFSWDYSPDPITPIIPVAGNASEVGMIGDVVNCMIPFSDDILIFGCDHSIWQMSGDPADGGRIDNVSEVVGMAWGRPWCQTPDKTVFFFGSRGGVYRFVPGSLMPERVTSEAIENELADVDVSANAIRMMHDDRQQTVHLWITPLNGTTAGRHFVYDLRHGAWLVDQYASYNYDPVCVMQFEADDPDDRAILLGCKDGYIRKIDPTSVNDDGSAINSYCWFNPILFKGDPVAVLKETVVICSKSTDSVTLTAHAGDSAEEALDAPPSFTRLLHEGVNYSERRRAVGTRIFLKLANDSEDEHWSLESINVSVDAASGRAW